MNTWGDLDNHKNKTIINSRDGGKGLCKKGKVMITQAGLNHVCKSSDSTQWCLRPLPLKLSQS